MKKLKIMLIAAGIMTSLSFVSCYAMENSENNENIMEKTEKLEDEKLESEESEDEEKKLKEESLKNEIARIKNEMERYKHLYKATVAEKNMLEDANKNSKDENENSKDENASLEYIAKGL